MPDLTVSMFDSPDAVPLGGPITYIATVTNRGDAGSIPTNLVNPLPIGSMVEDVGPGCDVVGNVITCLVPALAPGASAAFTFSLHAAGPIGGAMVNTATVDPSNVLRERDETNNAATTSTTIFAGPIAPPLPPQALPDLSVAVAAPRDPVQLGTAFSYKLTVTNDGGMPSGPTTLISNIPADTALHSLVAGCQVADVTVSCAVPSLPPGASMGFDVTLDAIAAGPISNTATVDPGNIVAEGDEANNSAAIVASVVAPAPAPAPAPPAQAAPPPAPMPSGDTWLRILLPTEAFSVDMDPLWTATPGEWYFVTRTDGGWALSVWEGDTTGWSVWIQMDGRVESVVLDRGVPAAPSGIWLVVLSATEAFAPDSMQVLWTAGAGEWYRVIQRDGDWALVVYESDPPTWSVWMRVDGRVELGPADAPHSTR